MKIVLFEANKEVYGSSPAIRQCNVLPLGLKSIESSLTDEGHDVVVTTQGMANRKEFVSRLISYNPDIIGATATTSEFPITADIIREVKEAMPNVVSVVGGYHVSAYPQSLDQRYCPKETSPRGIDILVLGEGEITMKKIADSVKRGALRQGLPFISGIAYLQGDGLKVNPIGEPTDLSTLPTPKWKEEELKQNDFDGLINRKEGHVVAIVSERGCPYGCSFCSTQKVYGKTVRTRPISHVADEIEDLVRNRNVSMIVDYAPTQNLDLKRIHQLCSEIRKRGLQKTFSMYALWRLETPSGRPMIDEDIIKDLTDTLYCFKIGVGIEALSAEDAEFIGKNHSVENLRKTSELFDRYGAIMRGFYMVTPMTSKKVIDECKDSDVLSLFDDLRVTYLIPFPGTPLHDETRESQWITKDWRKFTSEAPVMHSNYLSLFSLENSKDSILQGFLSNKRRAGRVKEKIRRHLALAGSFEEYHEKMRKCGFSVQ